jgi:hypothetical protein
MYRCIYGYCLGCNWQLWALTEVGKQPPSRPLVAPWGVNEHTECPLVSPHTQPPIPSFSSLHRTHTYIYCISIQEYNTHLTRKNEAFFSYRARERDLLMILLEVPILPRVLSHLHAITLPTEKVVPSGQHLLS